MPTTAESEAVCILDEFTGKAVEGAWDSVETDTCDSHRRENSTRVICEYFERDTGHWQANLPTSGAGVRVCNAGGFRGESGWEESTVICLQETELTGNSIRDSDSHSDMDIRRRRMIFRSCMTEFLTCTVSCHSIPSVMKQCRTRLRYVILIQSGCEPRWQVHLWFENQKFYQETKSSTYEANDNNNIFKIESSSDQVSSFLFQGHCQDWRCANRRLHFCRCDWRVWTRQHQRTLKSRGDYERKALWSRRALAEHLFQPCFQHACLITCFHFCTVHNWCSTVVHMTQPFGMAQDRVSCCLVCSGMHARYSVLLNVFLSIPLPVWAVCVYKQMVVVAVVLETEPKGTWPSG